MKLKKIFLVIFIIIFFISFCSIVFSLSKYGSSGEEVKKIQQKLKAWGYYNGNIDGILVLKH